MLGSNSLKLIIKFCFLFSCLAAVCSIQLFSFQDNIRFHHVTLQEGLSQNSVSCITQDSIGFIWFGTQDGLNKYDGYEFNIYRNDSDNPKSLSDSYILSLLKDSNDDLWIGTFAGGLNKYLAGSDQFIRFQNKPDDPHGLSNNYVSSLFESSKGVLWIGTYAGLNRFDPQTEQFVRYQYEPDDPQSLSHDHVLAIGECGDGLLWIGTANGLNKFDQKTKTFIHYLHQSNNPYSLSHNTIRAIFLDSFNKIWIGTDSGLNRFDPEADQFIVYSQNNYDRFSLSDDRINVIFEDSSNTLWVGTDRGLNKFDRNNNRFIRYQKDPLAPYSLKDDNILSIYEDSAEGLWLGTYGGGAIRIDKVWKEFKHYTYLPQSQESLGSNIVQAIATDLSGDGDTVWIGTQTSGIDRYERKNGRITNFQHQGNNPNSLSSNNVRAIIIDSTGLVWIGTQGRGLNRYDPQKKQFKRYLHNPNDPNSLSHDYVRAIYEDRDNILWIGTYEGGLNRFNKTTEQFTHYSHHPDDPNSISHNRIISIYEDSNGFLWIGTSFGLNKFDKEAGIFTHYTHDPHDFHSLSNSRIQSIYEDKSGKFWIGTLGGGINRFDPITNRFSSYQEKDKLPNNVVYGILEDHNGCLWLSTNKGLSKFDPQTEVFRNYDVMDGLQSNEFNAGAAHKSARGEMFFGGINGMNAFFPDAIRDNPIIPQVVITDFQLFNESVAIGEEALLKQHINVTKEISLSYRDNVISFEFAALNYISSDKNRFRYMMENFDRDWIEISDRNFVSYTSLSPGNYTFRVKGSNNDGLWNEEGASLKIRITPPFWRTWWFQGMALISLLFLITAVFWLRTRSIRERAKKLEISVTERTQELNQTNRELQQEIIERQQAEKIIQDSLREKEVLLKEIHHRVKNNMQIISSILRIQSGNIKDQTILEIFNESQSRIKSMALIHETLYQSTDLAKIDFSHYIENLTKQLYSIYRRKTGEIEFGLNIQDAYLDLDRAIPCGLIVNELISNSLKHAFTAIAKGSIAVTTEIDENQRFSLIVSDNGRGIPDTVDIFNTDTLGMQLTMSLVNQLGGKIELLQGKGTSYMISFNLD